MTLDEFFRECEKEGGIPLSYRSHTETINGSRTVEYENPKYAESRARLAKILGVKETGDKETDDLISRLYGEEVVIRTKYGYHHGKLCGFDGKGFLLNDYLFSKNPLDVFGYSSEFFHGGGTIVPAEGAISMSKIPLHVEKGY